MNPKILSIDHLDIRFPSRDGAFQALEDISFDVHYGQSVGIVGESGSGKSITALSVLNLLPPNAIAQGSINYQMHEGYWIDMLRARSRTISAIRGRHLAMIFQEPMTSLNPVYTCGDQVSEIMIRHLKVSRRQAKEKAVGLFDEVELPQPGRIFHSYPHELSGGQRQRVMIAMAIACDPKLLIADEPTTALDVTIQQSILKLLQGLKQRYGMSLIFISHDLAVVSKVADEIVVMHKGRIAEKGRKQQIIHSPGHNYTKGLMACKPPLDRKPERLYTMDDFLGSAKAKEKNKAQRIIKTVTPAQKSEKDRSVLFNLKGLCKSFSLRKNFFGHTRESIPAVKQVSLSIFQGETLGLVGESGSGKSTLARIFLKLLSYDRGDIFYKGRDFRAFSRQDLRFFRQKAQIIFQDPYSTLNPRLSVAKMISEPLQYYGYDKNQKSRREHCLKLLDDVRLDETYYNRYPHELSGGQRQRVAIARVLALNPEFIVCDEAVSALDVSIQAEILNLLQDLKKHYDLTLVFITHDFSVVRFMSDRVAIMKEGNVLEVGATGNIFDAPESEYTKKLLNAIPVI